MPKDNYVVRNEYTGLKEVDGQIVPQRGEVKPEELVQVVPDDAGAHNNGGGEETRSRRRRRQVEEE